MFTPDIINHIVDETNRYAESLRTAGELVPHSRLRDFKPTDRAEMEAYFALQIEMGLVKKPQIPNYWDTDQDDLGWTPNLAKIMSRNRFQLLNACLHFNNNDLRVERGNPNYDPLFKIRPLLSSVTQNFRNEYYPHEQLSIDESMVSFRGRVFFRQYIPSKRHRFGLKNFVLSDATSNYTYLCEIYTGGAYNYNREVGIGHSTVSQLMKEAQLLGKGHTVFTDNFYTSPALFEALHASNTGACGTVKVNRKGMPPQLRGLKMRPADPPVFFENPPLLAASFRDAGTVTVLSTVHDNGVITKRVRSKGPGHRLLRKPRCVEDYNRFMGGVDRADQMCSYYAYSHRVTKWYHRLYHHIKEVALVNAYILYKESGNTMTSAAFRNHVVKGLMRKFASGRAPPPRTPVEMSAVPARLLGRHFLSEHPVKTRPDCKVCSSRKRSADDGRRGRKQTSYFCKTCADHPSLCFELYHTKLVYKQW